MGSRVNSAYSSREPSPMVRNQGTGISRVINAVGPYIKTAFFISIGATIKTIICDMGFRGESLQNRRGSAYFEGKEVSIIFNEKTIYLNRLGKNFKIMDVEYGSDNPDIVGYVRVMNNGKERKMAVCETRDIAKKVSEETGMDAMTRDFVENLGF